MTRLIVSELRTVYDSLRKVQEAEKKRVGELADLFSDNPRLIITPSNRCGNACLHCVSDSRPDGVMMKYSDFANINPEFFTIFKVADFGRRGNPLLYESERQDLADLIKLLSSHGLEKFTIAAAIQPVYAPVIGKLGELARKDNVHIDAMITYHHYFANLDTKKLAEDFNQSLKYLIKFSDKIIISMLGDNSSLRKPSMAEEVQRTFKDNLDLIMKDMAVVAHNNASYTIDAEGKMVDIKIPTIDTRVYPLGRFRQYLSRKGILKKYELEFNNSLTDYVCPDLVRWPGIIIEPDGGLNLCASFEAIACSEAVVSNIFTKPYYEVKADLIDFQKKESCWLIDNIGDVIKGKASTCKLKNHCYKARG